MLTDKNTHSFDIQLAVTVGVEKAILIGNVKFWIDQNKINKRLTHFKEGLFWTYDSLNGLLGRFPYFKRNSVSRWLIELESDGWIKANTFNAKEWDKTKWYTLGDKYFTYLSQNGTDLSQNGTDLSQNGTDLSQNGTDLSQNGTTLPDTNTVIKTDTKADYKKNARYRKSIFLFARRSKVFHYRKLISLKTYRRNDKTKKRPSKAKSPDEYKVVHRMRLYIESISPSYAWSAKEATAASQIENKLRTGIKKVNEGKGIIDAVTDNDILNAFEVLIQRSYELPDFYQFSSVVKLNSNYNDVVERLRKPRQTNGTGKQVPYAQQSDDQKRQRVTDLFAKIDSAFGE